MVGDNYGIGARKQRWRDFLDPGKPPQHLFRINYAPDDEERPHPWPELKQERVEWAWRSDEAHVDRAGWLPRRAS